MRAIQISNFGNPTDVLQLVELPEPPDPHPGEAMIGISYAPINQNDLLLIRGTFHYTPSLPTIVGNEGVGTVLAIGADVTSVRPGDRVLLPLYSNSWRERIVVSARSLVPLPAAADTQQLAMLRINPPAAALMLSQYVELKPGDWVVQNAGNSGVGRAVIAFGKARGYRIISLVRRPDVLAEIDALGGDLVLIDDETAAGRIKQAIGDGAIHLALDGIGGAATARLANMLSSGGHLASYGFAGGYAAPADLRPLMDKEITLHSFYQVRPEYDAQIPEILKEATAMVAAGELYAPMAATYPLSEIKEAVAHAERGGKVLLDAEKE